MILKSELQMWLNENNLWHYFVNGVTKHIFLSVQGLQILILGVLTTKILHKQCNS